MPKRLDVYLSAEFPETSRSTLQKYIKEGYVTLNDKPVLKSDTGVKDDDVVVLNIPKKTKNIETKFDIIYEDENVIVIDKPLGILSHAKGAISEEYTVADFFKDYTSYAADTNRPGIVHRLDRDTSGVMLGVKNPETATSISRQFAKRKVKKIYYAVVEGHPKLAEALIDLPIARNPSALSKFKVDAYGKPAETNYQVIASNDKYSLVKLMPKTGRTHQLRVHMSHIGNPIVGDRVYGKEADRLYLHANSLEITIPGGERKVFVSPVPKSFEEMVK